MDGTTRGIGVLDALESIEGADEQEIQRERKDLAEGRDRITRQIKRLDRELFNRRRRGENPEQADGQAVKPSKPAKPAGPKPSEQIIAYLKQHGPEPEPKKIVKATGMDLARVKIILSVCKAIKKTPKGWAAK